jgi:hypothetical protein
MFHTDCAARSEAAPRTCCSACSSALIASCTAVSLPCSAANGKHKQRG